MYQAWSQRKIKHQILILYTIIIGTGLAVVVILSLYSIHYIGRDTRDQASTTLQTAIESNLITVGSEMGLTIEAAFNTNKDAVRLVAQGLTKSFQEGAPAMPQTAPNNCGLWEESLVGGTSACLQVSTRVTSMTVLQCTNQSSFHVLGAVTDVAHEFATKPAMEQVCLKSSLMDIFAKPVWEAPYSDEMVTIYAGLPTGLPIQSNAEPIFRQFPGYYRESGTYNPTERGWYRNGLAGKGSIVLTGPYKSSSLKIYEMTFSQAFYSNCAVEGSCLDNDFLGVVGVDLTIEKLTELVNTNGLYSGYSTLYVEATGTVYVHKDWNYSSTDSVVQHIDDLQGANFLNTTGIPSIGTSMAYTNPNGVEYFVTTYRTSDNLLLSIFALNQDAYSSLDTLNGKIDDILEEAYALLTLVGLATLFISIILALVLATHIARPVMDLGGEDGLAEKAIRKARTGGLGGGDEGAEAAASYGDDEIGQLHEEFHVMSQKIEEMGRRREHSRRSMALSRSAHSTDGLDEGNLGTAAEEMEGQAVAMH